ncbi:AI-2E family transporter [Gynuella sp.]|uniref:AI-2E family transporter n=1 Tax=Gynuella sp. TaxID=2969146 RepID=UPI003D0F6F9F
MMHVFRQLINRYFSDEEAVVLAMILALTLVVIYWLGQILAPIIAAVIIAYIISPLVDRLVRWKVPYMLAVIFVFLLLVSVILFLMFMLFPLVFRQVSNLVSEAPSIYRSVVGLIERLPESFPEIVSPDLVGQWMSYVNSSQMGEKVAGWAGQLFQLSLSTLPSIFSLSIYLLIVPILVFFMLKDRAHLWDQFIDLLPRRRNLLNKIGIEMNQQIANYVRGKVIEIFIVGGVTFVVFTILGIKYSALLSLLVGLSVLIPYIGAIVVTIPIALIGLFQWGPEAQLAYLLLFYMIIQFLDGNVLVPLLFSEAVNLHPTSIIIAVLLFGGIWGFWGVFFAIPLATFFKAIYNAWPKHPLDKDSTAVS